MTTFSTIIRTSAVVTATLLALGLLMLALGTGPAVAAFPGTNGKIAFIKEEVGMSMINPDGSGLTRLNDPWNLGGTVPPWSPDGTRIAFQGYRDGNIEIFIMNADGSEVRRVTNDPGFDLPSSWSPDGTKIAFVSNRDGNREIYTINVDGSGLSRLTNDGATDDEPAWSPDGTRIAFTTERDRGAEIYVMNADGSAQTNLTNFPGYDSSPAWSPDGRQIAFSGMEMDEASIQGIYTMNANGSGQTRLTADTRTGDELGDRLPEWSPDGTKIAFVSHRDNHPNENAEVYVMNADGSAQTNLTHSRRFTEYFPNWQPIPRCTITGTLGNDKLRGTAAKDVICGLAGNDTLSGWEGDDVLIGGKGDDAVYGGSNNDTFNGGPGTDTASYLGATNAVVASLTTNFATGQGSDVFVGIEDLTGTALGDTLEGSNRANVLEGLGGNDVLRVRDGRDNDTANGGAGSDACQRDAGDTARSCS